MEETFKINTPGINTEAIIATIRQRVEEKRQTGVYNRYNLSAIQALELETLKNDEAYLDYYLKIIWRAAEVDLGDFPIENKGGFLGRPEAAFKKIIWKLLKFYTFRLFSQQKDFNAKMASIAESLNRKYERRIAVLESKIEELGKAGDK